MRNKIFCICAVIGLAIAVGAQAQVQVQPSPGVVQQRGDQLSIDLGTVSSLIKMGDIPRAIAYLDRLLATYGNDPRIRIYYKQAYKEGKLYSDLERIIKTDLSKDPNNPYIMAELGEAKFLQNNEDSADSLWNLAIKIGSADENIYRIVADYMIRYGLYTTAVDIFLKGREAMGKPAIFSEDLANLYEIERDYPSATDEFLTQILNGPDQLDFASTKIRGYLDDSDTPEQIVDIVASKIKENPNRSELYEILGDLYIKQNKMDKALECYKTISAKQNDDGGALIKFAMRAFDSKAYSTAISAYDEYVRVAKKGTLKDVGLLVKAKSQLALGQIDPALANFGLITSKSSDLHTRDEAGFWRGTVYAQNKNDCDSALLVWDAMQKTAQDPALKNRARLGMAVCDLKKDKLDECENLIKLVTSSGLADSNMEKAYFLLGELAFFKGNTEEADNTFKQLMRQFPQGNYANDALIRLDAISLCGDGESAKRDLSLFARAMKAQDLDRPLEAAIILSDSIPNGSAIAEQAAFYAAAAFAFGGDRKSALGAYNGYKEKFPEGLYIDRAYLGLGDLYMQDPATFSDAKAAYDKILESFPNGPVTEIARQRLSLLTTPGKIG